MATKLCTDLKQSNELKKFLPLESADICWTNHLFGGILSSWRIEGTPLQQYKNLLDRFIVKGYLIEPAWSLSALEDILPVGTESHKQSDGSISYYYVEVYNNKKYFSTKRYDNLVDACVEMVLKLHELNLL